MINSQFSVKSVGARCWSVQDLWLSSALSHPHPAVHDQLRQKISSYFSGCYLQNQSVILQKCHPLPHLYQFMSSNILSTVMSTVSSSLVDHRNNMLTPENTWKKKKLKLTGWFLSTEKQRSLFMYVLRLCKWYSVLLLNFPHWKSIARILGLQQVNQKCKILRIMNSTCKESRNIIFLLWFLGYFPQSEKFLVLRVCWVCKAQPNNTESYSPKTLVHKGRAQLTASCKFPLTAQPVPKPRSIPFP